MKRLALLVALLGGTPLLAQVPDGAALYKRCAACHLPSGAGLPGAFPPLQADFLSKARTAEGRRYLALVVIKGLSGPLVIDGKTYRGVMPAQSALNDAEVAAVLNHVGTAIAGGGAGFRAFAGAEVAKARQSGENLASADVAAIHAGLGTK